MEGLVLGTIILLAQLSLVDVVINVGCASRVFCRSKEIKFISFSKLSDTYLEAVPLKTKVVRKITECRRLCLNEKLCFSINIKTRPQDYECQLLNANLYTNSDKLVKSTGDLHFYIKNECSKKPCKNDGKCVPNYETDAYSCDCVFTKTFFASGGNCEIARRGAAAANHYWSFNKKSENKIYDFTSRYYFTLSTGNSLPEVPGRRAPVVYCSDMNNECLKLTGRIACITDFSASCGVAATFSIWLKFTQKETNKNQPAHIMSTCNFNNSRGLRFQALPDRKDGYNVDITAYGTHKWRLHNFGKNVAALTWTHFLITYHRDLGVTAYINGVQDAKTTVRHSFVAKYSHSSCFRIGNIPTSNSSNAMFVDEFAVIDVKVDPDQVKTIYEEGRLQ